MRPGCVEACPGCAHRALTAEESLARKGEWLRQRLDCQEPVRPSETRWDYREQVTLAARYDNGWQLGMRRRDEFIAIPDCPVHTPRVRRAVAALAGLPPDFPLLYYVQAGAQATLVVSRPSPLELDWSATGLEGVWLHRNPCAGRRIFGKLEWTLLWGVPRSRDALGLWHGPSAFGQVNPGLYSWALERAREFLRPTRVVDLYCGTGASLQRWGVPCLGVELGREAVECARRNAPEAEVLRGPCGQRLPQVEAWLDGPYQLYVNPPRLGLDPEVVDFIRRRPPQRMAYLSCSAGTLKRDLEAMGLRVVRLHPMDFFPQTHHVEVLALLEAG